MKSLSNEEIGTLQAKINHGAFEAALSELGLQHEGDRVAFKLTHLTVTVEVSGKESFSAEVSDEDGHPIRFDKLRAAYLRARGGRDDFLYDIVHGNHATFVPEKAASALLDLVDLDKNMVSRGAAKGRGGR